MEQIKLELDLLIILFVIFISLSIWNRIIGNLIAKRQQRALDKTVEELKELRKLIEDESNS